MRPFNITNFLFLHSYDNFMKEISKGDFVNAPTRYMVELNYVNNLIESAKKYNLQEELQQYQQRKEEINSILSKFGITVND